MRKARPKGAVRRTGAKRTLKQRGDTRLSAGHSSKINLLIITRKPPSLTLMRQAALTIRYPKSPPILLALLSILSFIITQQ